jgi:leader peptidase (prepilin peptidase)/N-methyltransferase
MPVKAVSAALILPVPWLVSRVQEAASQPGQFPAMLQTALFAVLLLAAAWMDYREHIIPDILNLGIALSALLCFRPANLWGLLAVVPFLAAAMGGRMGGGDVKMVAACGLVLGFWDAIFGCIIGLLLMLCSCLVISGGLRGKEARPMAPFLSAGFLAAYVLP